MTFKPDFNLRIEIRPTSSEPVWLNRDDLVMGILKGYQRLNHYQKQAAYHNILSIHRRHRAKRYWCN